MLRNLSKLPSSPNVSFHCTPDVSFSFDDSDSDSDSEDESSELMSMKFLRSGRCVVNEASCDSSSIAPLAEDNVTVRKASSSQPSTGMSGLRWQKAEEPRAKRRVHYDSDGDQTTSSQRTGKRKVTMNRSFSC